MPKFRNLNLHKSALIFLYILFSVFNLVGANAAELTLKDYLSDVIGGNHDVRSFKLQEQASTLSADQPGLLTTPHLYFNFGHQNDKSPQLLPMFQGERRIFTNYSLGVQALTNFGAEAKAGYTLMRQEFVGMFLAVPPPIDGIRSANDPIRFFDATPEIAITQSLLKNFFGQEIRSKIAAQEKSIEAEKLMAQFGLQQKIIEAETAYYGLVLAREALSVQMRSFERAKKILQWSNERARLNLADRSDALQATANLRLRELELKTAELNERQAARRFNVTRGLESEVVQDQLPVVEPDAILDLTLPEAAASRLDVQSSYAQTQAQESLAKADRSALLPDLKLSGRYAMVGRATDSAQAMRNVSDGRYPVWSVGLQFDMPIDLNALKYARDGAARKAAAADKSYQQKLLSEQNDWRALTDGFNDAKERLKLSVMIERTQKEKLEFERTRFNRGRSTTYQVLMFEQDYAASQLGRLQLMGEVLRLASQSRLYSKYID